MTGKVAKRGGAVNENLKTGEIEIIDAKFEILEADPFIAEPEDVTALLNHLLTKKALTAEQAAAADLNGDKKLTAADLSLLRRILLA